MRILISAYACEPGKGSEPEVGLQIALIAASEHEVWLITRENNLPALRTFLTNHPLRNRIHLVGLDVNGLRQRAKKYGGLPTLYWYYDAWQRRLSEVARHLDTEVNFDVVHHATFAAYWSRVGVAAVEKPLIWGPVGGGVNPPLGLLPVMGFQGAAGDLVRVFSRPAIGWWVGARRVARQADQVLVQNPETGRRLDAHDSALVLPNALLAPQSLPMPRLAEVTRDPPPRIVTAGRLIGWKGTALAVRAMQDIRRPAVTLDVYGVGPQRDRLHRLATKIGAEQRVRFFGQVQRQTMLKALIGASVLLHPALHEEAGFVVAEALAAGTPVVCLNRGGPAVLTKYWPLVPSRLVTPSTPRRTVRALASAIDTVIGQSEEPNSRPTEEFEQGVLAVYQQVAHRCSYGGGP